LNHNLQDFDKNASFQSAAADAGVKFKYTAPILFDLQVDGRIPRCSRSVRFQPT
jgi:hypothetical protein